MPSHLRDIPQRGDRPRTTRRHEEREAKLDDSRPENLNEQKWFSFEKAKERKKNYEKGKTAATVLCIKHLSERLATARLAWILQLTSITKFPRGGAPRALMYFSSKQPPGHLYAYFDFNSPSSFFSLLLLLLFCPLSLALSDVSNVMHLARVHTRTARRLRIKIDSQRSWLGGGEKMNFRGFREEKGWESLVQGKWWRANKTNQREPPRPDSAPRTLQILALAF